MQVIVSTACKTAGEALREVDIKDVIKSDFVLVSGDVVSNMDLGAALEAHKMRRDKNKNALMTMVLRPPRMCHPQLNLQRQQTWEDHTCPCCTSATRSS